MDVEGYKYLAEGLKLIGAGLMAIGAMGAAIGVGQIFAALLQGLARNPAAEPKLAKYFILSPLKVLILKVVLFPDPLYGNRRRFESHNGQNT